MAVRTSEEDCVRALRKATVELGRSPSKAEYESLGLTPASGTIIRVMGGWNAAKDAAGLETYRQGQFGGTDVQPKPEWVELPEDEEWESLSGHQRWYRKNIEYSRLRKGRRRRELVRWVYEYKDEHCECERCGEKAPACLDFHHPGGEKEYSVSQRGNRGQSINKIKAEIDSCVVLCANCHRKEHYRVPEPLE